CAKEYSGSYYLYSFDYW
nr:immunoglobulin heavy chain junction region [Macaca mulatta]